MQVLQQFGKVDAFNIDQCVQYVQALVHADEVERALLVLDNVPAYYRFNAPPELLELKRNILNAICTPHSYVNDAHDCDVRGQGNKDILMGIMRGQLLINEVAALNKKNLIPHIIDCGPGEYIAPLGLEEMNLEFTYKPVQMDVKAFKTFESITRGSKINSTGPSIFLGWEIIEHLPNPHDLASEALRNNGGNWPHQVHLSTPLFTFDGTHKNWNRPGGLPHLRAYTPTEFGEAASKIFPGYNWNLYCGQIMSAIGTK